MPASRGGLAARAALSASIVVFAAGCPELNHWDGPAQHPLYSVPDPLPTERPEPAPGESADAVEEDGIAISTMTERELPDPAR